MSWKKILFLVILVTVSVAVFELAFLFDFESGKMLEAKLAHNFGIWLFMLLQVFFFLPCFVLGYGRTNALWGFIPPVFLTAIFWILMIRHLSVTTEFSATSFPFFYHYVAGSSFLGGIFGILVVYLVKKIITKYSKPDKEDLNGEGENVELESAVSPDKKVSGVSNNGN